MYDNSRQWWIRTRADEEALEAGSYFDETQFDFIMEFLEAYGSAKFSRGQFRLLDWQRVFVGYVLCWKTKDGKRRFRRAILHTSKKSGG